MTSNDFPNMLSFLLLFTHSLLALQDDTTVAKQCMYL